MLVSKQLFVSSEKDLYVRQALTSTPFSYFFYDVLNYTYSTLSTRKSSGHLTMTGALYHLITQELTFTAYNFFSNRVRYRLVVIELHSEVRTTLGF
ncbi:hypothetical protein MKHDV_02708 [Halodesulfovibrio sp. MK-HDV]|nr:hypothetical protein MKHDV_02708 [Halodesulfovibrio sp. MK-HDV]